ncbi:MAG: carboxypeptidase regulatory-like domain-containing protein [Planctomycetota bacterium]
MTRRGLGALAGLLLVIGGAVALAWSRGVGPFAPTQDDAAAAPGAKAPGHVTGGTQPTDAALAAAGRRTSTRDADRPAGAAAAARPTTLRVFVTVNDVPRAGVTVRVRRWNSLDVLATKETDAQGACEFPSTDLRVVEVEAWAAGLCPCGAGNTELERDTNVVRLEMRPGREVVGRVIDAASGAPVAGASVLVNEVEIGPTDADGRFRLSGVEPGVATEIVADHVGFFERTLRVRAAPPDVVEPPLELALERCTVISGIVRDADGNVAADARVYVTGGEPGARLRSVIDASPRTQEEDVALARDVAAYSPPDSESTRTAADGSFSHPLPPGRSTAWVRAVKDGFGPSPVTRVDVASAARPIELRLQRAARLEIEVVGPGGPCDGAFSQLVQAGSKFATRGALASFDNLSDEPAWLLVGSDGLRSVVRRIVPVAGTTTRVTVSLDAGRMIEGLVVDEGGQAVAAASVIAAPASDFDDSIPKRRWWTHFWDRDRPGVREARTDPEGRFRFSGLDATARWLDVWTPDRGRALDQPLRVLAGAPPVRIVVTPRASVLAQVLTTDGAVPEGTVHAELLLDGDSIERGHFRHGSVEFRGLDRGEVALLVHADGWAWAWRRTSVRGAETVDLGTVRLERGRRIPGTVVDRRGAPIPEARVDAADCLWGSDTSDVHGRFLLEDFPPPPFDLQVGGMEFLRALIRVTEVPAGGLRLVVTRRGRVRGQVVDADGTPAVERLFYLRRVGADAAAEEKTDPDVDHDDPWQAVVSGPDGRFEHPVEPGTWAVRTDDDEAETSPALQTFTITDGETRDVKIVWPADAPK